jgi:hypothetical protein
MADTVPFESTPIRMQNFSISVRGIDFIKNLHAEEEYINRNSSGIPEKIVIFIFVLPTYKGHKKNCHAATYDLSDKIVGS